MINSQSIIYKPVERKRIIKCIYDAKERFIKKEIEKVKDSVISYTLFIKE